MAFLLGRNVSLAWQRRRFVELVTVLVPRAGVLPRRNREPVIVREFTEWNNYTVYPALGNSVYRSRPVQTCSLLLP